MGSKSGDQPMYTHPILLKQDSTYGRMNKYFVFNVTYTNSETQPPGASCCALILYIFNCFKFICMATQYITLLEALHAGR